MGQNDSRDPWSTCGKRTDFMRPSQVTFGIYPIIGCKDLDTLRVVVMHPESDCSNSKGSRGA